MGWSRTSFAEGEDGETAATEGTHGMEAGRDGRTGGDDIVHEQDMLMVHLFGMGDGEYIFYILRPVIGMEQGLFGIVDLAQEMLGINGNTRDVRQATGDPFGLVVAAFTKTLLVERHGHDYIDSIEEIVGRELTGCNPRQLTSHIRTFAILHLMNGMAEGGVVVVEEEGRSGENMRYTEKELLRTVLP